MKALPRRRLFVHRLRQRQPRGFDLRSEDGVVAVHVAPTETGIFVERTYAHPATPLIVMAMLFEDAQQFAAWCDADAVRFDYPMLFRALKRDGHALFR